MKREAEYPYLEKSYCNECGNLVDFDICIEKLTEQFKGKLITFEFTVGRCKCCGSEVATDIDYNYRKSEAKWEAYRQS